MAGSKKSIGIIGGAGPMASCQLYRLIINKCQETHGSVQDADFPEINIISYPFANMLIPSETAKNRTALIEQLQGCFDHLAQQASQIIAIACNTLHIFLDSINVCQTCTFVHIAQATREHAKKLGADKLLFLGTSTTAASNVYSGCLMPTCSDQKLIDGIIANIHHKTADQHDAKVLANIIQAYPASGVVLGCTELPLLYSQYSIITESSPVVLDTLDILAHELVRHSFN